jgi:murein DD-endopeptidase MepM/ murein hydrolase activator NlpD
MEELNATLADLDRLTDRRADLMAVVESRLFEQKVRTMMVPTQQPVVGNLGSNFGWRIDPFTGRTALHTGLDFQATVGTPILAAAGGVVVTQEFHPEYGNMIEVDHGKDLITRYAHTSRVYVKKGDLIKRGQRIADVGNTGRSTGPHLHFEVLVRGVPQDPQKFLTAGRNLPVQQVAMAAPATTTGPTAPPVAPATAQAQPPVVRPAPAPVAAAPAPVAPPQPAAAQR